MTAYQPARCNKRNDQTNTYSLKTEGFFYYQMLVSIHRIAGRIFKAVRTSNFNIGEIRSITFNSRGKGKAVPLQSWSGPDGYRKLRFPDFMTTAQDCGKVVSLTYRPPLPPRKCSWYSFPLEAESTPGP